MKKEQPQKALASMTDRELQEELKRRQTHRIVDAVMIGVVIGIVITGAVQKGLRFFTLLPLPLIPLFTSGQRHYKAVQAELAARKD